MKAFITRAILVLSLALAGLGMSGCVIHAHHTDGNEPAKTHKKKKKSHKAKPPKAKKSAKPVTEAKPAKTDDNRKSPPPPPAPR